MASMVFASSPLSAQSLVKLRTNSNYPRSSCYVPSYSEANSYNIHLSYKISHIESSKSSFTTGDGFSKCPLLKFPRVASTLSPSLNIIKASTIYDFNPEKFQKNQDSVVCIPASLKDYKGRVLLIVNIPQQGWTNPQINYFNKLREEILQDHKNGFEVLGFIYDKKELDEKSKEERTEAQILKILDAVTFPIFKKDILSKEIEKSEKPLKEDLWCFLTKLNKDFETLLVNGKGIPESEIPWFEGIEGQSKQSGPGYGPGYGPGIDMFDKNVIKGQIKKLFEK